MHLAQLLELLAPARGRRLGLLELEGHLVPRGFGLVAVRLERAQRAGGLGGGATMLLEHLWGRDTAPW